MSLELLRARAACAACIGSRYVQHVAEDLCLLGNITASGAHPLERQKSVCAFSAVPGAALCKSVLLHGIHS